MNKREEEVAEKYERMGFKNLHKGWPDFIFYNDDKIFFVEVKRKQKCPSKKMGLSSHQSKMISLLKRLGVDVCVEYL